MHKPEAHNQVTAANTSRVIHSHHAFCSSFNARDSAIEISANFNVGRFGVGERTPGQAHRVRNRFKNIRMGVSNDHQLQKVISIYRWGYWLVVQELETFVFQVRLRVVQILANRDEIANNDRVASGFSVVSPDWDVKN